MLLQIVATTIQTATTTVGSTAAPSGTEIGQIALHGVLIGIVSMAILQMAKDFLFSRSLFQASQVRTWLARRAQMIHTPAFSVDPKQAEQELTLLATGGDESALYRLPVEQLCGQMIAAAQTAMDSPRLYVNLLACLGGTSEVEYKRRSQVLQYFREPKGPPQSDRPDLDWVFNPPLADLRAAELRLSATEANSPEWNQDNLDQYKAARNRVGQRIQRSVDGLQIYLGSWWKLSMQICALTLSFLIASVIAPSLLHETMSWGFRIAAAFIGGFLAPVFRDVLAILGKLSK